MPQTKRSHILSLVLIASFLLPMHSHAQKIDTISTFSITGYVDAYYAYYSDSVGPGNFQKFGSTSPRSNSPSINTAQLSMQYNADKIRGTVALHFGDIPAATWAAAPYNYLMEAHVGVNIYSKLWIDAGFFRTHFGTEFLLPVENITSSVAVGTYYEPYYESGVRLNFDPTTKLEINLFLLNGYNMFIDNNNKKSFGMGATYTFNSDLNIGYTNYIGDDTPPGTTGDHLRIHQNAFLNYQHNKFKLQAGGDFCMQQNSDLATESKYATMYSALATGRYQLMKKMGVYVRGEVFNDPDGYMSTIMTDYTGRKTGYKLWGATAGVEYKPTSESYVRLEGRRLQMDHDQYIYYHDGEYYNYRYEVMVNAGVTFDLLRSLKTRLVQSIEDTGNPVPTTE